MINNANNKSIASCAHHWHTQSPNMICCKCGWVVTKDVWKLYLVAYHKDNIFEETK